MENIETPLVEKTTIHCDGGGGPLGHPLIYLTLDQEGVTTCPYCGRHYDLKVEQHQSESETSST